MPANQVGFKVLPRRWIVERSLSWLMRARRNARDDERLPEHSEADLTWSNITLMARRLTRRKTSIKPRSHHRGSIPSISIRSSLKLSGRTRLLPPPHGLNVGA
jgi:hypothetical protein